MQSELKAFNETRDRLLNFLEWLERRDSTGKISHRELVSDYMADAGEKWSLKTRDVAAMMSVPSREASTLLSQTDGPSCVRIGRAAFYRPAEIAQWVARLPSITSDGGA